MKKKFYTLIIASFCLMGMTHAQTLLYQSFDDVSTIGNWQNSTAGDYTISQSADAAEGTGSLHLAYNLVGDQGWGGSVDMQFLPDGGVFADASDTEGISFWYKVPAAASEAANVSWNVQLFVTSQGEEEQWLATVGGILDDASGEWQEAKVPFSSFAIPSWLTTYDGVLYKDQITKMQMQIVGQEGTTTTGEIQLDALGAYAAGGTSIGTLIQSFDTSGDITSVQNSDGGSHILSSSTDGVEGMGSTCLLYNLVADQSWGGSVDLSMAPADAAVYPDMSDDDGIRWNYKVITPASESAGVNWNVKLLVNSTGGQEEWHGTTTPIFTDESGEWQEAKLNFSALSIPNWLTTYDGVLRLDSIAGVVMQIVTNNVGLQTAGELCLDNMTSFKDESEIFEGQYLNDMEMPLGNIGSWQNSTAGSFSLTSSTDAVEGDSSVCVSYGLVGDQGWGGSIDMQFIPTNGAPTFQDLTDQLGLMVWYKVTTPVDVPANANFVVKIFDGVDREEFHKTVGGVLNNPDGEWTRMILPFVDFATPNWLPSVDGVIGRDSIVEVQFQILAPEGATANGALCFDNLRSYDDEEVTDLMDPPNPPTSVISLEETEMKIYPNPAYSELFIQGDQILDRIEIFNINGLRAKVITSDTKTINVMDLQNGLYVLKIYSGDEIFSTKFMKH